MPEILSRPDPSTALVTGHRHQEFSIGFTSWPNKTTSVTWYHDGVALPQDSPLIQTTFGLTASTNLTFGRIMRADSGTWRVVIENNVEVFPVEMRRVEESFQIRVTSEQSVSFPRLLTVLILIIIT